ncbi:putative dehydrogenase [Hyaloraphidium curvatum]|nr:putative dehydrogenase [Hyaloraphidium curvatum]
MPVVAADNLRALAHLVASRMGSSDDEAKEVAGHLVGANLAGHDSHGVGMLPAYVRLLKAGLLVPNQTSETVVDFGALLVVDARRGFGHRAGREAVEKAIARARETGACVLALRNASHIGRVGHYAEIAASAGCAFSAYVNVSDHKPIAATWQAAEARLGTNPFCAAVPVPGGPPLMLDMATTTIAHGKARVAYNKGQQVAPGCLLDAEGNPTTDPTGMIKDYAGALTTFGLHKGSGLAIMCEAMAAGVAGGHGEWEPYKNGIINSMLATVIDLSKIGSAEQIGARVGELREHIKGAKPGPGFNEVLVPGEPERRYEAQRLKAGIDVDDTTWGDLRKAAEAVGITAEEFDRVAGELK